MCVTAFESRDRDEGCMEEGDRKAGVWMAERKGRERDGEVKKEYRIGKRQQTHTVY
jgi:hypothetical protein